MTRRGFLLGTAGAGVTGAAALALAQPERVADLVVPPSGDVPDVETGTVVGGFLESQARSRRVKWAVAHPPGFASGASLPIALVLHGKSGDAQTAFREHSLHRFLAQAVESGAPPYALVSVDGGNGYWHKRTSGDDPMRMVLDELLPLMAERGLRTSRFAVTGWSMGGFGALLLALTAPDRVTAVSVDAAALWRRASETAPGAFDGPADFASHDVLARASELRSLPVRIGCGRSDPFIATNQALARALPSAEHQWVRGRHTIGCWNQLRPAETRFLGQHL